MADIIDQSLNTTHITGNLNQYEAARSNFFVFQVAPDQLNNLVHPDFDTSAGEPADSDKYNGQIVSDYLRLNVVKASVPNFKISNVITYRRGNDVVKMAGVPEFEDGSITVDDVVGLHVKDMLYSWLYLAYDPHTRKGGRMVDYKKTATLLEYTQDYKLIRYWILDGCFVTGIDEGEFDREGGDDKRQLTVAISFDRAMMYTDNSAI
jgi:hypothetical protein